MEGGVVHSGDNATPMERDKLEKEKKYVSRFDVTQISTAIIIIFPKTFLRGHL